MFDEQHPTLGFCLASEPVGKPQGQYVLLLAPQAQINYLFALIQRKEAALDVGKRERTEGKKVVVRGEREEETKKRKWKTDRAALFTQTPHLFLGKETGCTQMRSYSFFSHWRGHEVKCFVFSDGNYTVDE